MDNKLVAVRLGPMLVAAFALIASAPGRADCIAYPAAGAGIKAACDQPLPQLGASLRGVVRVEEVEPRAPALGLPTTRPLREGAVAQDSDRPPTAGADQTTGK